MGGPQAQHEPAVCAGRDGADSDLLQHLVSLIAFTSDEESS